MSTEDGFEALRAMGARVQVFEGLAAPALYSAEENLIVVDAGLSAGDRDDIVRQLVARMA